MSCKCATFDPDEGRYTCAVSGDGCMYLLPSSQRCAKDFGEGPDTDKISEEGRINYEKAIISQKTKDLFKK